MMEKKKVLNHQPDHVFPDQLFMSSPFLARRVLRWRDEIRIWRRTQLAPGGEKPRTIGTSNICIYIRYTTIYYLLYIYMM